MRIYLDSSALIKRSLEEAESDTLDVWLNSRSKAGDTLCSSTLAWVEASRAIRSRLETSAPALVVERVELALSGIEESPIDESVASLARRLGPVALRSLDAIHLATAILLDADLVVGYDERLIVAAEELGLATASPS